VVRVKHHTIAASAAFAFTNVKKLQQANMNPLNSSNMTHAAVLQLREANHERLPAAAVAAAVAAAGGADAATADIQAVQSSQLQKRVYSSKAAQNRDHAELYQNMRVHSGVCIQPMHSINLMQLLQVAWKMHMRCNM
jgi:hypothetical protein